MGEEMNEKNTSQPPVWFWIVSGTALVWNLLGLMAFVMQVTMSEAAMAELPVEQQELYKNMPSWVNIAFGVAVVGGTIGSIGLLLRKKWTFQVFVVSLVGVLAQMSYLFFLSDTIQVMGAASIVMPIGIVVIGIGLIVFSKYASQQTWLA
jgi:hypothetical protein